MSRGPPHRFNPTGERSFRGYPPIARYGEFSGSSSYGYYSGPPYKRQRRLSEDDVGPSGGGYGPAYYDPPYVRHQEVGLGDFNDFSSISGKDIKIERDGTKKDHERSELQPKKRQTSTEGSGYSIQNLPDSAPSSPHSKVSPRFSPCRPTTPPFSVASQPLLITASQLQSSKAPSVTSPRDTASFSKQHSLHFAVSTSSQSMVTSGTNMQEKLKNATGRPAPISLLPSGGGQRKDSYPGPAVEAISPSAPASEASGGEKKAGGDDRSDLMSKDELLQSMEKVDREITQVEQQINNLKKKQRQLEEEACKQSIEPPEEEAPLPEPKPKSVVQIIYKENKKKAETAAGRLAKFSVPLPGGKPLYNQPSDLPCYHENLRRGPALKAKLVKYFQLRKQAKELKNRQLCKEYKTLKQAWLKKIERNENNPKRKQKEAKLREFYEKVFPEIRKQREQTERFTRMGSRSNWGIVARSEAEFNEIVDNLNEQEANERHMRTLAVEPPPMLDKEERRVKFINRNGLIRDPLATLNERKHKNIWTEKERRIFKDKFIQNPKDFDLIASFLPGKSVSDCILFYYQTKKKEHYKQLSRRHNLKKRRRDQSQFGSSRECAPTNKARTSASESSTKGERGGSEGEEDLEEITDSAEESDENDEHAPPPVTTAQVTTPTPSVRHTGRPDHVETSRWSEKEIEIALQGLRDCGRDWEAIARRVVTKTGAQCKNFYFNYKKKLRLEALVAEHEATKMQRAQQQQQQRQPPQQQQQQQQQQHRHQQQQQLQPQPQRQPQEQQRDNPNITQKREPTPKKNIRPQTSDSYSSHSSNPHNKPSSAPTDNGATTSGRESTSVIVGTRSTSVGPPGDVVPTATSPSSIPSLELVAPRIVSSHSPHLPLTSSSSILFMPTSGVIASIGRASPNVTTEQPGQGYFQPSLPESKHDTPHSRSPHPETIFPGLVHPRAVNPRVLQSDPSHLRPSFLVSSRPGHPHSDVHPLYQGSAVRKPLGYSTDPPHSSALLPSSSSSNHSNKGVPQAGSSHPITSHPGISHTGKSHVGDSYGHSSHSSEPSHAPTSSILFASSGPPVSVISNRVPARPSSNSPVPVVPQTSTDQREKPHSQVPMSSERSKGYPVKPPYPNTYPVSMRGEPTSRSTLSDDGRRDGSPKVCGVSERSVYAGDTHKPDVIVIDADDQKKKMEGHHRLETSEGKQASSMLRMLASGGNVPTSSADYIPQVTEPVRPQSLPLSSGNRVISHTELRPQQSATPPGSLASRQQTLNPPPPLIQMSSSRDKKYVMAHDLALVPSRSREGSSHTEAHHDRHVHVSQETTVVRDKSRHTHTPVDNRGGEREKRVPVVETVDLTRDKEVCTSSLARPTARSPGIALGSSSARATLQAMARYALAETSNVDVTEKIEQKRTEDMYLPPRQPDPKLSTYEKNEAIRKFTALGNVCVSASREFPGGGEYPSQPYALMAMQAHHQPHVHSHPARSSTPPPYGYPFHVGHPMASFHHHQSEHPFLVPVGVHQIPVREILPQSVNGEDLPSHSKLSGAYTHQYPQGATYYSQPSMRSIVPTYQQMTVYGHRYPVSLSEERHALHHPHDVPVRRQNEISEQELAHPFVVKPPRHMHAPGMPERVVSPGELPKFPLPSQSPKDPAKRPHTISPEMKPQIAAQAEAAKTVSPPVGNYLSRKPSRPTSVSEMRNRAAVIPDLTETKGVGQKFPEPQPVVLVPSSKFSSREKPFRSTDDEFTRGDGTGQGTKEQAKEEKAGPLAEALPMSAFATLVDVAAAARKVDVPIEEHTPQKGTTELQDAYESSSARLGGRTMVSPPTVASPPPSPTRTSPGVSSTLRYGITTGRVPKLPPLMPITGMRPSHDGSSTSSSTPISISITGHGNVSVSRSPSKLISPPGTRSTRASVSPEGPPPLISRPAISPTSTISPQGTSSKGPPPLIKGIVPTVPPALRSPERGSDSTRTTRSNLEDITLLRRPDQEDTVSRGPFQKGIQSVDVDFQRKFGMHFPELEPASSQKVEDGITNRPLSPHGVGQAQVRTIFETITYVDSGPAEGRPPWRHQLHPYQAPFTGLHKSEKFPTLATSSSPMCTEDEEKRVNAISRSRTSDTEKYKIAPPHLQPECSLKDQKANADQKEKNICQVNQTIYSFQRESQGGYHNENFSLPQSEPSARKENPQHAFGSETEEGDEGDEETEDEVPPVHSSSATLHPRIRALTRSSQSNVQSSYYDASDSETLSAEESEGPPESSDEMFPSTTVKSGTQSDSSSDDGKDDEHDHFPSNSNDTGHASADDTNIPGSSRDYSDDKDKCVREEVTSTGPLSLQVFDVSTEEPTVDSPTTSTFGKETEEILESPDVDAKGEREMEMSDCQETREEMGAVGEQKWNSSKSSPSKLTMEEDSSEALPAQKFRSIQVEDAVRVDSSEDGLVGSSETDEAAIVLGLDSSDQKSLQITPDSSANLRPDGSVTSPSLESNDNRGDNVQDDVASIVKGDSITTAQAQDEVLPDITDGQSTWTLRKEENVYECPSTSKIKREDEVSSMLDQADEEDEDINEADALERTSAEHEFLIEPDTYSSSSENHHPEISSAVDCVSDDGEQVPYATFVGEYVPLAGGVDSPDIKNGCSTYIPSEVGSVCGEMQLEREMKDIGHLASPKQEEPTDVLSPDDGVHHPDDTLSAGEIPSSQESSQSEDEHLSSGKKVTSGLANEPINVRQSSGHFEESHSITDHEHPTSQSTEIEEGEIPESEDEPTVEPSQGSPSDTVRVSSTLTCEDVGTSAEDKVSSSQEVTLHTDCYINMIPISPAPPESPNHESQGDRTSPLPPWPPLESQYSPVVSLSLAARMTSKGTPFPYSTLSINVGSASSSARSSPVPQSLAVNMAQGSSPSSGSLLPRPQEPTPLLSDSYEPLSDDGDDGELADSSNTSDEHNI